MDHRPDRLRRPWHHRSLWVNLQDRPRRRGPGMAHFSCSRHEGLAAAPRPSGVLRNLHAVDSEALFGHDVEERPLVASTSQRPADAPAPVGASLFYILNSFI